MAINYPPGIDLHTIHCPQNSAGNNPPYQKAPPYGSCHSRPFIKLGPTFKTTNKGKDECEAAGYSRDHCTEQIEQGMAAYWLGNKLEFVNVDKEWHFEPFVGATTAPGIQKADGTAATWKYNIKEENSVDMTGDYYGRLFVKMPKAPSSYKWWSRMDMRNKGPDVNGKKLNDGTATGDRYIHWERSLYIDNTDGVTIEKTKWFAAIVQSKTNSDKLTLQDNEFYFSSHGKRSLKANMFSKFYAMKSKGDYGCAGKTATQQCANNPPIIGEPRPNGETDVAKTGPKLDATDFYWDTTFPDSLNFKGDNIKILRNVFKYAEGKALDVASHDAIWEVFC